MTSKIIIAALATVLATGSAAADPPVDPDRHETSIPFADDGGIRDFDAVDRNTVYLEGRGGQWYRATTAGPCPELPYAIGIGVDTGPCSTLSRGEALIVEGRRCPIASLVKSERPPGKPRS